MYKVAGKELKLLRECASFTLSELGKELGVSAQRIYSIEKSESVHWGQVERYCVGLGLKYVIIADTMMQLTQSEKENTKKMMKIISRAKINKE